MPPFIEVISGLFSANIMRKPATYVPVIPRNHDLKSTKHVDPSQKLDVSTPVKKSAAKK